VPLFEWLNRYANLLLVVITAVYAFLTWKTLRAMERANSREQRARHLDRIKASVAVPIQMWLANEVAGIFSGSRPAVPLVYNNPAQPGGQRANQFAQVELTVSDLDAQLLDDALVTHFPRQLDQFGLFDQTLKGLFVSFFDFAKQAQREVEKDNTLPPHEGGQNQQRFADCPSIIQVYLRALINGQPSPLNLRGSPGVIAVLESSYSTSHLAMAPYAELTAWRERFERVVRGLWHESGLQDRVMNARNDKDTLWYRIGQIELTETLRGNCSYITEPTNSLYAKIRF